MTSHSPQKRAARIEGWKERIALTILSELPTQEHPEIVDAMLELAIEIKIKQLGMEQAGNLISLVTRYVTNGARGPLN